ncbi:MAG: ABC transporter permease subunit [Chloroflexi bacterium]|nr:ABC transporter permease subunit [Chloroflexota bacterium]
MQALLAIIEKELRTYFASPIAYVVTAAFLALTGLLFVQIVGLVRQADLRPLFSNIAIVFVLLGPVLTMRLLAEEARSGAIELLLTAPVRDATIIAGKFLAGLLMLVAMLVPTLYYPLLLGLFSTPDWGPVAAGYLGVLLLGSACLALGLFTSSLTENQIVAAVLGIGLLLTLWVVGGAADLFGGPAGALVRQLELPAHFFDFPRGVIDSRHVVFFASVTAAGLFLSYLALQSRRWR